MKKLICIILILLIVLSFTGCKKDAPILVPEENSSILSEDYSVIQNESIKILGSVSSKVLTPIDISTTSCDVELSLCRDETVLWTKTIHNVSVKATKINLKIVKVTEDKVFVYINNAIHCFDASGTELWVSDTIPNLIDNCQITSDYIFTISESGITVEPKVNVYNLNNGKYVTTIAFEDIDCFYPPISVYIVGNYITIKDSLNVEKSFNVNTFNLKTELPFTEKEIVVNKRLTPVLSSTESFPKMYNYTYENYNILLMVTAILEDESSLFSEETIQKNEYNENYLATFLGDKVPIFINNETNSNILITKQNGLIYTLAISNPENATSSDIYLIASSFSFK